MSDDMVEVNNHSVVNVLTASGERKEVLACKVTGDDINDDGTINYPPSGKCDCGVANHIMPSIPTDPRDTRKHTTGTIDGYAFSLRVDGDAPAGLVADIESALAEVKQERENDE